MDNKRALSLYDVEQFLRDAGAERINEKAVISLEKELRDTVNELIEEASVYAMYAGRMRLINLSDIELASNGSGAKRYIRYRRGRPRKNTRTARRKPYATKLMLVNNVPVVKEAQGI
ncbi:MAG: hypothetical protein ACREBH_04360 [Candidatus Micrarchaeaceae archaeon]